MSKSKPARCTAYVQRFMGMGGDNTCGNPSKGPNAQGEPRCGVHSAAAKERTRAKQEAASLAERERRERWARASYVNALSTLTEAEAEAVYNAVDWAYREAERQGRRPDGDLVDALAKLATVQS